MINVDEKKLENVLLEVLQKQFAYAKDEMYIRIDNVDFDILFSTTIDASGDKLFYQIRGAYGMSKDNEVVWQRDFTLDLHTDWSWDFVAGYFCRQLFLDESLEEPAK